MTTITITANGITAKQIESANLQMNQRLWRVQVGALILHRITSKGVCRGAPETFIFTASESGAITDWCELPGSCGGERSHVEAITSHLKTIAHA